MSVHIGELRTEISVGGSAPVAADPAAATPPSFPRWTEAHRQAQLTAATARATSRVGTGDRHD